MTSDWVILEIIDHEGSEVVAVIDKSATLDQLRSWVDGKYPKGRWVHDFTKDLLSGVYIEIEQYEVIKL